MIYKSFDPSTAKFEEVSESRRNEQLKHFQEETDKVKSKESAQIVPRLRQAPSLNFLAEL